MHSCMLKLLSNVCDENISSIFSVTNGHENGRRCWFLVNFLTEKHAVLTYSFHKKYRTEHEFWQYSKFSLKLHDELVFICNVHYFLPMNQF